MPTSLLQKLHRWQSYKKEKRVKHDSAYLAVLQEHNNLIVKDAGVKGDQERLLELKENQPRDILQTGPISLSNCEKPRCFFSYKWAKCCVCVCPHIPCVSPLFEKLV